MVDIGVDPDGSGAVGHRPLERLAATRHDVGHGAGLLGHIRAGEALGDRSGDRGRALVDHHRLVQMGVRVGEAGDGEPAVAVDLLRSRLGDMGLEPRDLLADDPDVMGIGHPSETDVADDQVHPAPLHGRSPDDDPPDTMFPVGESTVERAVPAASEIEQVGDEFSNLLQRDGPDVRARRLGDASTLRVVGRCAWATPNPPMSTSLNHPRLTVVQGTTTIACCRNSSTSSEVTTIAGRTNPGSPRAGVPKSQRDDVTRSHRRRRWRTHPARPHRRHRVGRLRAEPR